MPPLPPVTSPACIKIEFTIEDEGSIQAGSRIFMSYTGTAPSAADLNTLATAVRTHWTTYLAPYTNNTDTFTSCKITDLSSSSGAIGIDTTTSAGTESDVSLPSSAAVCMVHSIGRRYRGGKPKTFLRAGFHGVLSGTNEWEGSFLTNINTAWHNWITAIIATTGIGITLVDIVNISYYDGFVSSQNPITLRWRNIPKLRTTPLVDSVTLSTAATKIGSQRRRLNV